jgi:hypothetical protein
MIKIRKSPSESATLEKLGTKKYGNDGNIWIVSENKNKVKKWVLYKKIIDNEFTKLNESYHIPNIIPNNWKKWLENLNTNQKKFINKIRKSYKYIEKLDITVIEIILPISRDKYYFIDYAWDYANLLYPDIINSDKSFLLILFKLDTELNLYLYKNQIHAQHTIKKKDTNNFLEFIEKFNKYPDGKCKWNGSLNKTIIFYL